MPGTLLHRLLRRVEESASLDPAAERLVRAVGTLTPSRRIKCAACGTWLGHALHPVLTDFADGAWMGASFLDVFGPRDAAPAARRLLGFGLLAALPTAATGLVEWADTGSRGRRVGMAHVVTSATAFSLYGCSYLLRRRRHQPLAAVVGVAGGLVAIADGYLGGHLSLVVGVGVDHTTFEPLPADWTAVAGDDDLAEGRLLGAAADGASVLVTTVGGRAYALAGRCSYRGAALHEGNLDGEAVVCPAHGCTYRLEDGAVVRGPASVPQPTLDVRVTEGRVEVRSRREWR